MKTKRNLKVQFGSVRLNDKKPLAFAGRCTLVIICLISIAVTPLTALAVNSKAPASSTNATAVPFTDWRYQAQTYNTAMQQIAQAASMPIRNQTDLARALSTLQKAGPVIERGRVSAAIKTAADNASFQAAVRGALARRCGTARNVDSLVSCVSSFINQTAKDRASFNEAGGTTGLGAIQARFKSDSDALKRLGTNMSIAIKNLKPANARSLAPSKEPNFRVNSQTEAETTRHHAFRPFAEPGSSSPIVNNNAASPQTGIIEIPVAIAMAVCATGGVLTGGTGWAACAAGAVIIAVTVIAVAWAALKSDDFFVGKPRPVFRTNPDSGDVVVTETKTDFEVCKERADGTRETCLAAAGNNFWATSGCWAAWTLRMADCLLLPQ